MKKSFRKKFKSVVKKLYKSFSSSFPKPKKEESEFGKSRKNNIVCNKCKAIYQKGHWLHPVKNKKYENIKYSTCPACKMIESKQYEGEVIIENVNSIIKKELLNAIANMGKIAYQKDPEDRLINIQKKGNEIRIFTTENQLAVKIGKKIKKSFNGNMKIVYSKKESVVRVHVVL